VRIYNQFQQCVFISHIFMLALCSQLKEKPAIALRISSSPTTSRLFSKRLLTPVGATVDAADVTCAKIASATRGPADVRRTLVTRFMNGIVPIDPKKSVSDMTPIRKASDMNLAHICQGSATSVLPFA
jgi:hypothetical protein